MLISFKVKNFKQFRDEVSLNMKATSLKELDYSLTKKQIGSKSFKILSSSVIYGPNASGKTSIISAMDVFKNIIQKGNINNSDSIARNNVCNSKLEFIPHKNSNLEPTSFKIQFVVDELLIDYRLTIMLGNFLDDQFDRYIQSEELYLNNDIIFSRNNDVIDINISKSFKPFLIDNYSENFTKSIFKNLSKKELFLNSIFKTVISNNLFDIIYNWINNKLIITLNTNDINMTPLFNSNSQKSYTTEKMIDNAIKIFGSDTNGIVYMKEKDSLSSKPFSRLNVNGHDVIIPSNLYESYGSLRFINVFPLIFLAITNGLILVLDEFDASIHPMAIMNIIKLFHNDEINTKGAQLIFNTHNPIFLNSSLFRRDEIKFVEKSNSESIIYSLSDFKTNGTGSVRNGEDYIRNYFISKYGAIEDIDFSEIFTNLEATNEKESNK